MFLEGWLVIVIRCDLRGGRMYSFWLCETVVGVQLYSIVGYEGFTYAGSESGLKALL